MADSGVSDGGDSPLPLALTGVLDSRTYQVMLARLIMSGDPDPYPLWHETQALLVRGNYAGFANRRSASSSSVLDHGAAAKSGLPCTLNTSKSSYARCRPSHRGRLCIPWAQWMHGSTAADWAAYECR